MEVLAAFLRSSTSEANQFKARLAEVQTALGGVGQKLAMNVKFGDKSGYEWAKKLAEYLEGLDVSQLQKAADIVKNIAFTIAGLKGYLPGCRPHKEWFRGSTPLKRSQRYVSCRRSRPGAVGSWYSRGRGRGGRRGCGWPGPKGLGEVGPGLLYVTSPSDCP